MLGSNYKLGYLTPTS